MKVVYMVKSLMPVSFHNGNGQAGMIIEVVEREIGGTIYQIRWCDGEMEYMAASDIEVISESR